jgi:septum formation protein
MEGLSNQTILKKGIILASRSPRRKQLLEWAEVPFEICVKETDESYPLHLSLEEVAIHIARNKGLAVKHSNNFTIPILSADTIVVLNSEIIGKPVDQHDAVQILTKLSGKKHKVITGVVILYQNQETVFADTTEVEFHPITRDQIEYYVNKYKPFDKAGAYAIQEWIGVIGIKSVTGDFYNVMGLPVSRVIQELQNLA